MSEVFTQAAVVAALVGAVVAVTGWFVVHHLQFRRTEDERRAKAELAFLERQIEELYGPLSAILHMGRRNFTDLCLSLGRTYIFRGNNELPPHELSTWLYWVETEFLPRNKRISKLLHSKAHLIHGGDFPESFIAFFQHSSSWATNHRRWKDEGVEYSWRAGTAWPQQFEKDVFSGFSELKARHNHLLGRISART